MIRLYHISTTEICTPDVFHSREHLDFGRGFYLTPLREQAEKYGQRFLRKGEEAILNVYELDEDLQDFSRIIFEAYDNNGLIISQHAVEDNLIPNTASLKAALPMTRCLTPLTSTSREYTATSRHWTNYDSSIPTIKCASPTSLCLTNIFISWNL